jgi:penicillin-binding protein 1A
VFGRRRKKLKRAGTRTRPIRRLLYVWLLFVIAGAAGFVNILGRLDLPDAAAIADETTIIVDRNGEEIARLHGEQNRVALGFDEVSPILVDAVIAAEDRDFFTHPGVDPVAIARALWADVRSEGVLQGGSTITQQYVKNAFLTPDRTLVRKLKEASLSIKLERETNKQDILEGYLNTIYFGRGAYGIGAAAKVWFGVNASELDIAQSAYLAGLIRAPEIADISREQQVTEAYRRRTSVLVAMLDEGYISQAEFDATEARRIEDYTLERVANASVQLSDKAEAAEAGYAVEMMRQQLTDTYGSRAVFQGGLRVTSTLDLGVQLDAFNAATAVLDDESEPTAAIVVLDQVGGIRALVGGRDFETSQVNLATGLDGGGSGRQPGSLFKPVVLAEALRQGISVMSQFSAPATMDFPGLDDGDTWTVHNYADADLGIVDLFGATRWSSNTAYAQLIVRTGPSPVADLAHELGVSAPLDPVHSLVLGTQEVSVLDMATSYATFAAHGERYDPQLVLEVVDRDGEVIDQFASSAQRVLSSQQADIVTAVLSDVVANGTGRNALVDGVPVAGKTGTTQDYRDAWFVGYSPRFTTAVWVGFPDSNRPMENVAGLDVVTGGSLPAAIWRDVMTSAHRGVEPGSFAFAPEFTGEVIGKNLGVTTTVPETTVPETTVPETTVPETAVPETTVPDTTVPADPDTTLDSAPTP